MSLEVDQSGGPQWMNYIWLASLAQNHSKKLTNAAIHADMISLKLIACDKL